jgi:hypothetical protein
MPHAGLDKRQPERDAAQSAAALPDNADITGNVRIRQANKHAREGRHPCFTAGVPIMLERFKTGQAGCG